MAKGRGRLSAIRLLPPECGEIVAWAAEQLQDNARTQLDIYQEFIGKLDALKRESRGEIEFKNPSLSMFNRYSIFVDDMTRTLNETREMAAVIADTFDAKESDDLTLVATEAIKALVFTMLRTHKNKIDPKGAKALADALRSVAAAQGISTSRRQKVEKEMDAKVTKVIDTVAKEKGMSPETVAQLKRDFLGVRDKPKEKPDA